MGDAADIKEYANKVFVAWGLGQKNADNGVLIVLSLKERMVRIEVGKGLEEYLTDAGSAQIIRLAKSSLSKGDYNSGLLQISREVQNAVSGKFAQTPAVEPQHTQPRKSAPWVEKTATIVNTIFFSALGLGILWVFWTLNRDPKRNKQKVDDENQSSPSPGTTRVVKTWGPDEFKTTDSNRYPSSKTVLSKSDRAAMGITAAAATSAAIATSSRRHLDDHCNQESSWSPSYDSPSSSSSSSDCCSGGGGDSGGGGSDSSF